MRDFMRRVLGEEDYLEHTTRIEQHEHIDARRLQWQVAQMAMRVEQLELVCAAALELLGQRGLSQEDLQMAVARIDLEDGVEDGRIGPDQSHVSPACGECGKPVNPKREVCVFCGSEWTQTVQLAEHVHCQVCGDKVDTAETWFTEDGITCHLCHDHRADNFAGSTVFAAPRA